MFTVMKECDDTVPNVQSPTLRSYPYLARESVPDIKKILATLVKEKVASRLGERGCEMLSTFIEVNEIIKEEMIIAMNNGSGESYRWDTG